MDPKPETPISKKRAEKLEDRTDGVTAGAAAWGISGLVTVAGLRGLGFRVLSFKV